MEKILKITTPTAKKEHVCSLCGKTIKKGERYMNTAILKDKKVRSQKAHLECSEKQEKLSEKQECKGSIYDDTLKMLHTFTFKENMDIAITPLIIAEMAWHYAFKVTKYAAEHRIPETVKLSRAVKMLRQKYIDDSQKCFSNKKCLQDLYDKSESLLNIMSKDFMMLWFSVNNDLKKDWSHLEFLDMRTDAYISIVMCEFLKEHNMRMNDIIERKIGHSTLFKNPIIESLEECMRAYVSPASINFSNHVRTSMAIFHKNISRIDWSLK